MSEKLLNKRIDIPGARVVQVLFGIISGIASFYMIGGLEARLPVVQYEPGLVFGLLLAIYLLFTSRSSLNKIVTIIIITLTSGVGYLVAHVIGAFSIGMALPVGGLLGVLLLLLVINKVFYNPISRKDLAKISITLGLFSYFAVLGVKPFSGGSGAVNPELMVFFVFWQTLAFWLIGGAVRKETKNQ